MLAPIHVEGAPGAQVAWLSSKRSVTKKNQSGFERDSMTFLPRIFGKSLHSALSNRDPAKTKNDVIQKNGPRDSTQKNSKNGEENDIFRQKCFKHT